MIYRRFIFIAAFFLFVCTILFSLTPAQVEEYKESWITQKNVLIKTDVLHCAGNSDNSLFLMAANDTDGGHSVVWCFFAGKYNVDNKIRPIWDKTTVSSNSITSLVYSPLSNKFYFVSAWADADTTEKDSQGLYTAAQSYDSDNLYVSISHEEMEIGEGHLAVNKTGVWLLHDISTENYCDYNALYKIEDSEGSYLFEEVQSTAENSFISFYDYNHSANKNRSVIFNHIWEGVFQSTDYTLLICDKDTSSWWLFDCITGKPTKYDDFWSAKKNALRLDKRYEFGLFPLFKKEKPLQLALQIFEIVCFIFAAVTLIVLIIQKSKKSKSKSAVLKERNKMIFDIQEKERAKISRDIHDSVVQDIRVLRLETENLVVDEGSKQKQTKIADLATDCIIKLRNICYNLAPAELASHTDGDSSKLELISIINSLVQQFTSRTHIPCVFKVDDGFEYPVLEKEITQNLFRVIQEALTNIEKHSYATQASIFMKKDDEKEGGSLLIYVTDDGIGCNQNELERRLKSKEHLGLRSMKDRMELIGGQIEFFSKPNEGMEITLKLSV